MEKSFSKVLLVVLAAVCVQANYLDGLRVLKIEHGLIDRANAAIIDLKETLRQNVKCEDSMWGLFGGLLRGSRLLSERRQERRKFRGARGDDTGYAFVQPEFFSQDRRRQSGLFSGLYKKVLLVSELLNKVKTYILQYNNVVLGDDNEVSGTSNVVIGSRNSLTGNNDWVFASDYKSSNPQEGVLILDNYLIELTEIFMISYNPREVIHCIKKQDSNQHFKSFWSKCRERHRTAF